MDRIRLRIEACDGLQGFFIFHALGGGCGSALAREVRARPQPKYKYMYLVVYWRMVSCFLGYSVMWQVVCNY